MPDVELELNRVREAYTRDTIGVLELERFTEHVLRGGYIEWRCLDPRSPIMDVVRLRRQCRASGHVVMEYYTYGSPYVHRVCRRCNKLLEIADGETGVRIPVTYA